MRSEYATPTRSPRRTRQFLGAALVAALALAVSPVPATGGQARKAAKGAKSSAKSPKSKAEPAAKKAPATAPARRDPFEPLVAGGAGGLGGEIPSNLPAGKAGLVVNTLRLEGAVRAPNGMIAVVSSPQQRVYFLREGDQLYNGQVERITLDGITLREHGKDAFGKPLERVVTKRLYPSPGEQQ